MLTWLPKAEYLGKSWCHSSKINGRFIRFNRITLLTFTWRVIICRFKEYLIIDAFTAFSIPRVCAIPLFAVFNLWTFWNKQLNTLSQCEWHQCLNIKNLCGNEQYICKDSGMFVTFDSLAASLQQSMFYYHWLSKAGENQTIVEQG